MAHEHVFTAPFTRACYTAHDPQPSTPTVTRSTAQEDTSPPPPGSYEVYLSTRDCSTRTLSAGRSSYF